MSVTIKDVAQRAKVSPATVSNVINRKAFVDKQIRERVLKAIDELGYRPSRFARGLRRFVKDTPERFIILIGLSMPHYYTEGMRVMAEAVKWRAAERGAQVIQYFSDNDAAKQVAQVSEKVSRRVDAVICFPVDGKAIERGVEECVTAGIPFISLNRFSRGEVYAVVKSDDHRAGNDLGMYLVLTGGKKHHRILELAGDEADDNARLRGEGFRWALNNWQNQEIIVTHRCRWNMDEAYRATERALAEGVPFDTVYCHNDELAEGAFSALKKAGKIWPRDHPSHITLLGIDGNRFALEHIRRGFMDASSEQPLWKQGMLAVDFALDSLRGKPRRESTVNLPTRLVTQGNVEKIRDYWAYRLKKREQETRYSNVHSVSREQ